MTFSFSLLLIQSTEQPQFFSQNITDLVLHASLTSQVVLGILAIFSITSWGIIFDKYRVFSKFRRQANQFLQNVEHGKSSREIMRASKTFPDNPFSVVYQEAYLIFSRAGRENLAHRQAAASTADSEKAGQRYSSDDLVRVFDSAATREILVLEKNLSFLATTGSVSPFFGLFGTVWGVMSSFLSIGATGSADLSVVAPGIAEALITTLAGLAAAIPAVIAYNYFVNQLKRLSAELEVFYANLIEAFARKEQHEIR